VRDLRGGRWLEPGDRALIGACGIDCSRCRIYLAYTAGDVEWQRQIIRDLFGEDSDIKPEQITCGGCGGDPSIHWSPDCRIRLCAHGRGLTACSQCPEFPCSKLEGFYAEGYEEARRNALRQREVGLEAWWREEVRRGRES